MSYCRIVSITISATKLYLVAVDGKVENVKLVESIIIHNNNYNNYTVVIRMVNVEN